MAPLVPIAMQLAQFAPGIIKLLTGSDKAEEVAGKVVDLAKVVTGTDAGGVVAGLQAAPAKLAFGAQQADLEKAYLGDVENARARDVELYKAGFTNRRADVMVALDLAGLIACLAVLVFFRSSLAGEVVGILSTIAGIFGACLQDAHQFEFGSSRSSREKDLPISHLTNS